MTTTTDVSSACDDVNKDQQYGRAPPLLAMNRRGYTVLHVHNESSASGQAPEEEGPAAETGEDRGAMRGLQVDRLQIEEERPGRRVQRSQLRLASPNGIPFV